MKRLLFAFLALFFVVNGVDARRRWTPAATADRTIYFGNCTTAGATPVGYAGTTDFANATTWYGADGGSQDFVCPGSGNQTIQLMGFYANSRSGTVNARVAVYGYADEATPPNASIYDPTLTLVGQTGTLSISTPSSPAWQDSSSFTGGTTIIGGKHYKAVVATPGVLLAYAYTTGVNTTATLAVDYTAGLPSTLSGGSLQSANLLTRVQIVGSGTAAPAAAYERYYVDPSYGGGGSNGSSAKPYTSLNAAIAARCNKTLTLPIQFICRTSSSTADTTRVDTGGLGQLVTSASNYIQVLADAGQEAGTSWDATKYHLEVAYASSTGTAMNIPTNYFRIENIQIGISGVQSGTSEIVYWSGLDLRMSGSIIRGAYSSTQITRCMSVSTSGSTCKLWNNIFYGIGANTGGATANIQNHGSTDIYSCTFVGYGSINVNNASDGNIRLVNCYAGGAISAAFQQDAVTTGSWTSSYIISSDSSATGTGSQTGKAVNLTQFNNVLPTTEDFGLPGAGSALYQSGTDTSGTAAPLNFTTAIGGSTRTSPWSVGAANN